MYAFAESMVAIRAASFHSAYVQIRFHHLRHTTASLLLMSGADLAAVQAPRATRTGSGSEPLEVAFDRNEAPDGLASARLYDRAGERDGRRRSVIAAAAAAAAEPNALHLKVATAWPPVVISVICARRGRGHQEVAVGEALDVAQHHAVEPLAV